MDTCSYRGWQPAVTTNWSPFRQGNGNHPQAPAQASAEHFLDLLRLLLSNKQREEAQRWEIKVGIQEMTI
jgi:hypothetical protein